MNLEGNIGEMNLIERLVELWQTQFTGAIRFENDGVIKILYFKQGDILSASTNDRADSIDEILMRAGKVGRDHVKQALAKRKENETLGDALLNLGFITRKELSWARRVQVVGVIRSIAAWADGSFTIVADYLPKRDEGTLFPLPQILIELIVTEQDRARFEAAMDGGEKVFEKSEMFDNVFPGLGLNEDADAIAATLDGTRSAREVASVSGRDAFNVYKLLHALAILGVVRESSKAKVASEVSFDDFAAPVAEPHADQWRAPSTDTAMTFDFEDASDAPALDFSDSFDAAPEVAPPVAPPPPAESAPAIQWDDTPAWEPPTPEEQLTDVVNAPVAETKTVAWGAPARESAAVPIQVPIEPAADADEEQWGFDEAQLETSRRAVAADIPKPKRSGGRRSGLVVAIIALLILVGGGYGGFLWWTARQEAEAAAAAQPVTRPTPPPAAATATTVPPASDTGATATGTIVDIPTTTLGQTPPATSSAAPAAATPVAAAPVTATPASPERDRLDAMARQYAASPSGNYTVQIQILCDPGNLAQAMRAGGSDLWFVPQPLGTRSCYRVFWGRFNSEREASTAMANIPRALRDPNAAVKPVPRG